jgi:hypothetical protein
MPLLRLLHQISNMYQNVKETQMELKEQQPEVKRENSTKTNKNGSSSGEMISVYGTYPELFTVKTYSKRRRV